MTYPAPPPLPLDEWVQGTIPASGNLTLSIGPASPKVTWQVSGIAVATSTNTAEPTVNVYNSTRAQRIGGTYTGSNDQMGCQVTLRGGRILADWTGADPGAVATLSLTGTLIVSRA